MTETVTIKGDGISLDLLLWRRFGRKGQAMVEATLVLNPGLADLGAVLPLGTVLTLPDPPATKLYTQTPVDLFGR